jgi:uncharacterized protein (DUF1330 family)
MLAHLSPTGLGSYWRLTHQQEVIMAAYAIGSLTVRSTEWQQEYGARMPALIQKHGGKVLAKAPPQAMEGAPHLPGAQVIIEFPSAAQARAWYDDAEHAPLKRLRQDGADFSMVLVDGV